MLFWLQVINGWKRIWTSFLSLVGRWIHLVMEVPYLTFWKHLELLARWSREYITLGNNGSPKNNMAILSGSSRGIRLAKLTCWLTINRSISITSSILVARILMSVSTSTSGRFAESILNIRSERWKSLQITWNRWPNCFWNSIPELDHCSCIMWC